MVGMLGIFLLRVNAVLGVRAGAWRDMKSQRSAWCLFSKGPFGKTMTKSAGSAAILPASHPGFTTYDFM